MNPNLYFNTEGKIKILQFTDIHYTDQSEEDKKTIKLMYQLIEKEKPDFIICTGDTVYGSDNVRNLKHALQPIIESNIPFTYTFGNHDTEEGEGYEVLFQEIISIPNCILYNEDDKIDGMGNHYIQIKDSNGNTKWVLFGIDSLNYNQMEEVGGYGYVKNSQILWYKKSIKQLEKESKDFNVLTFMHMALHEYHELWEMEVCYGEKNEGICSPRINSGFFTGMLEAGHTKGVFVGHDHVNDFYGKMYGIWLGYGRATGYNTYGQEGFLKGARIFLLSEDTNMDFETYVVLEDGAKIRNPNIHKPERIREE